MATHKVLVTIELETSDERWELAYGESATATQMAQHIDGLVIGTVRTHFERVGIADVIRSTPSVAD